MASNRFPQGEWAGGSLPVGADEGAVARTVRDLMQPGDERGTSHALLVVHGGSVVVEEYGEGITRDSTLVSWSMAKSMTHALVGLLVGDGLLSPDDADLFEEWSGDKRRTITLRHLMNMTSGLQWTEDYVDDSVSDVIEMLFGENDGDHASYAVGKPIVDPPGSTFVYSSGTTNIITRILARAVGDFPPSHSCMESLIRSRLFGPVGMRTAVPKFDKAGNFVGSSFVYATARDFARFGWLYLNGGVWDGVRVLPEGWAQRAWVQAATDPENGFGYSEQWWLFPDLPGAIAALGYEGQFTIVDPARDLVVVRLGKTPADRNENVRQSLLSLVRAFPAAAPVTDKSGGDAG